jgi:hypothetical protein
MKKFPALNIFAIYNCSGRIDKAAKMKPGKQGSGWSNLSATLVAAHFPICIFRLSTYNTWVD